MTAEGSRMTMWGDCCTCSMDEMACLALMEQGRKACCGDCRHLLDVPTEARPPSDDARSQK